MKMCVMFEGRDAAGKGGVIKRIIEAESACLPCCRARHADREGAGTMVFSALRRRVAFRAGEIVLFDRSWYNRAGVEHVMGFCTDDEYREFLRACPLFEEMLIRSGIILVSTGSR